MPLVGKTSSLLLRSTKLGGPVAGSAYEAESEAIFAAFTTPADTTRKGHINTCVAALKTAGVWALTDNLYVLAAAAADQALINWKNPGTFDLTAVNTPTFVADQGYTSDGSTSYLDSAWDPGTNGVQYTQDSAHIGAYARTAGTQARNDVGNGTAIVDGIRVRSGIVGRAYVNSGTPIGANSDVVTPPLHMMGIRRVSTDVLVWRDGSQSNTGAATSASMSTVDFNILRTNSVFSDRQIAIAHWGAALDDTQAAAYYTALHTYMVAVGADT